MYSDVSEEELYYTAKTVQYHTNPGKLTINSVESFMKARDALIRHMERRTAILKSMTYTEFKRGIGGV